MQRDNNVRSSKAERGGDTSRTSSQGRKQASGGQREKRGHPEIDETTHSPKAGRNREKHSGERKRS